VIPLQFLGQEDVDLTKLSASELMVWGMNNLWGEGKEGVYAVKHGALAINTFGVSRSGKYPAPVDNYWEKAFPVVFPYGEGGFEGRQQSPVSLAEHARWALQYHDRRFRRHPTFSFVLFGILQRRQALLSAKLQMHRADFKKEAALFESITLDQMKASAETEERGESITDPVILALLKHVHAIAGKVNGTDASRVKLRSMMWSMSYMLNPPNLWLTVNPDDIDDPIVQLFAGENINLSQFDPDSRPSKAERATNVATDPYAAAMYFNFIIELLTKILLGVEVGRGRLHSAKGIFGKVSGYFGVVETQGRGALHLHMLIWLEASPSGEELITLLSDQNFKDKVKNFITQNIKACCPGTSSIEDVRSTPVAKSVAWTTLPKPKNDQKYREVMQELEFRVARAKQIHSCKPLACLVLRKSGTMACKRKAPWHCSQDSFVNENGECGPRRTYGYVNAWNPVIATHIRCNHDIKLLTNGSDSAKLTYYCTCYAAKRQKKSHNMSAVLAKTNAFGRQGLDDLPDCLDASRLLLFRCFNAMTKQQEIAAPLAISYLMGWGETYVSHRFVPIFWSSFVNGLLEKYPTLITKTRL
jgi:hypothetical protein